jgi:hypothetical protein
MINVITEFLVKLLTRRKYADEETGVQRRSVDFSCRSCLMQGHECGLLQVISFPVMGNEHAKRAMSMLQKPFNF